MPAQEAYDTTHLQRKLNTSENKLIPECYTSLDLPSNRETYSTIDHSLSLKVVPHRGAALSSDLSSFSHVQPSVEPYESTRHKKMTEKRNHYCPTASGNTYSQLQPKFWLHCSILSRNCTINNVFNIYSYRCCDAVLAILSLLMYNPNTPNPLKPLLLLVCFYISCYLSRHCLFRLRRRRAETQEQVEATALQVLFT